VEREGRVYVWCFYGLSPIKSAHPCVPFGGVRTYWRDCREGREIKGGSLMIFLRGGPKFEVMPLSGWT